MPSAEIAHYTVIRGGDSLKLYLYDQNRKRDCLTIDDSIQMTIHFE